MPRLPTDSSCVKRTRDLFGGEITSIECINSGWTNVVVIVNDEWVYRFSRNLEAEQFRREIAFLKSFSSALATPVPDPVQTGEDYMVYRKLRGRRFAPEDFVALNDADQSRIIQALGDFLRALHRIAPDKADVSRAPYGGESFWSELWPDLANELEPDVRKRANAYFEQILHQLGNAHYDDVLTHSDLGTNNILIDFDTGRLSGIIDFSDIAVADPAVDFAGFYRHFGREFLDRLMTAYAAPLGDAFIDRVEYHAFRKVFFVAYFAKKYDYTDFRSGLISQIEKLFRP